MKSFKAKTIRFSALVLVLFLLFSSAAGALTFVVGGRHGSGTITSVYNRTVESGVTYSRAVFGDASGDNQFVHAMEFNPKTGNYMPLVYSQYSGYGSTTLNSAKDAETKYGYNVVGGVNASFFSMTGTSCNTYGGVNISAGKVIQGSNSYGQTQMLVFDSSGNASLVSSRVTYALAVNGSAWQGALAHINIFPETTGTGIYYYDTSCGNNTDTNTAGVEVVFEKAAYSELTVGGTLRGTVVAKRDVSSGGAIGMNRFVLYASNSSSYAASLRALAIGSTAEITVTETVAAAKTQMEKASNALVTYGYRIVENGINVTATNGLGESFNRASAQRSAVGIKADGSVILIAADGRTTYPGLTVYELADLLIGLGCVTGVNLDGGGSTQMTVQNTSGTLVAEFASTRRVANSLLIVQRPSVPAATVNELNALFTQAQNLYDGHTFSNPALLQGALDFASSVKSNTRAIAGDYIKAIMRLREAIDNSVITGYNTGIYQTSAALVLRSAASDTAGALITIPAGTSFSVTQVSGDFGYTKYLTSSGWVRMNGAARIAPLSSAAGVIQTVAERTADSPLVVSWAAVPGAAGYTYRIIELVGAPDPGNPNESANAKTLAFVENTLATSVTIPAAAMENGKYIKVALAVHYPQTSTWSSVYVTGSLLPFTDVPTTAWFYNSVAYVYGAGLFSGTSPTTFSPDGNMTRAMMATVLYRLAGSPSVSGTVGFTDVPVGTYYYNAVLWASQNGIVSGYNATTFAPDDLVTREQAAVFLYRYAVLSGLNTSIAPGRTLTGYADYQDISSWALTQMTWAVDKGIITANAQNQLTPRVSATRAQIATMLYNFHLSN